ncbi:hypothetical protein PsorP6_014066 [Peronosclerospora sorghi]|uniref:Uncharacterized protein n=1 Tax=Peronosclerospora sorghi TaxID=230839 RepID=A0ACC0VIN9_9STRA|nr:hypothetical protein PsorP6_014066 [Peronosclerospora sorghi]
MKDRVAAMWWTVKPDLDATTRSFGVTGWLANTRYVFRLRCRTNETTWSPYSEASTSCRTLPGGIVSIRGEQDDDILSASRSKHASLQNGEKKRPSDEEGTEESERLIFVVEGSQACARLVQQYQAEAMDVS